MSVLPRNSSNLLSSILFLLRDRVEQHMVRGCKWKSKVKSKFK
jgi:hypothetical protein